MECANAQPIKPQNTTQQIAERIADGAGNKSSRGVGGKAGEGEQQNRSNLHAAWFK